MKKNLRYLVLFVFIGVAVLLVSSYSKMFYGDFFQANPTEKEHTPKMQNYEVGLTETISADTSSIGTQVPAQIPEPENSKKMHIIIVPYFEPTDPAWQTLFSEADKNPGIIKYAIINPCSGPCGDSLSSQWQQIVLELQKRKIKTLGYIFDNAQTVKNIDYYMRGTVSTDGIFFDNEGSSDTINRFRPYADYVHSLDGIVYINPGFNYPYIINYLEEGLADVANVYEFESAKSHHIDIKETVEQQKVSAMLGNVHTVSEMKKMLNDVSSAGIGTVYIFSDSYYGLPPFFSELVKQASVTQVQSNYENS